MAKKKVSKKKEDNQIKAFVASFFTIIGFIVALIVWKDDKKTMFYAKEGLVIFMGAILAIVLKVIPFIGDTLYIICSVGIIILWVITWLYALTGEQKRTWLIGDLADKLDF